MQAININSFSMAELAWTSLDKPSKIFRFAMCRNHKTHPTQKPVELYAWIYRLFARAGDHILDTHLGSGTSAVAAHQAGLEFTGCEINRTYYKAALRRLEKAQAQQKLV